jgi:hypothetical protein
MDNVIAALELRDRVDKIDLRAHGVCSSLLKQLLAAMQEPFLELTSLKLATYDKLRVIPDSFLGGSAPRLQVLSLERIPYPGLPKLLLSSTRLVTLSLLKTPHSGYISPEAMVTALSTLTRLEILTLEFQSTQSRPDQECRHLPPPTRYILPSLTQFGFAGVSEYLEEFMAHIDTPLLNDLDIHFLNDLGLDTLQFIQFISRTPNLNAPQWEEADIVFHLRAAVVSLCSETSNCSLMVKISCGDIDRQLLSSLEQVCTALPHTPVLERLYIHESTGERAYWKDDIEDTQWLELLHPFTSARNLHICKRIARRIVPALQDLVGAESTQVLPALQSIFLEGRRPSEYVQRGLGWFVDGRQEATGHTIHIIPRERSCNLWEMYLEENRTEDDSDEEDDDFADDY